MASLSSHVYFPIKCSSARENDTIHHKEKYSIKVNGTSSSPTTKVASVGSVAKRDSSTIPGEAGRQSIPTEKQMVDPFRQGHITEGSVGYNQIVVIRSYEIGADRTATLEAILNLLQETALNHVWNTGLLSDGFGATHCMVRNNLIWVVTKLQLQVDSYPIWGEVVEINTWVGAAGKNGMSRDWIIRNHLTGQVFARATSTWAMMNQQTRRLSKMPDEVRAEIVPWFIDKHVMQEDISEKITKLDDKAKYLNSGLKPKRSDIDMNQHVNNVKYVRWMLEAIPDFFLESHQLSSIILEYKRECGRSDIVQSLCQPDEEDPIQEVNNVEMIKGFVFEDHGLLDSFTKWALRYTHLLQTKGELKNEEIVRGRTTWKKKRSIMPFSA